MAARGEKKKLFKKLKLTTKLTLLISAVVMVVFAVLITITVVTSRASIYTGISGELASIAEFNGGEIQSGFDTVERRPWASRTT